MTTTCFNHPHFKTRVLPVIVLSDETQAVPLAHALLEGGIDAMEITLRSGVALRCIEAVARAVPEMHLGAGTVTRPTEVTQVMNAGASFALSPGCTDALVDAVRTAHLPFIPGVMTPSEVMRARDHGFTLMKLFPSAQAGGMSMLKALGAPLPDVRFCPTGGVNMLNLRDLLAEPNVAMAGGSWLTPTDALQEGDWKRIAQLAREASTLAAGT